MNRLIVFALLMFGFQFSNAQSPLGSENIQLNGGLGFLEGSSTSLQLGGDYGINDLFTVGAQMGIGGSYFSIGANGNYHFDTILELPSEWNVYGGANLTYINIGSGISDVDLGLQAGGRYFFDENWAANFQLGGGTFQSGGIIGVTYLLDSNY